MRTNAPHGKELECFRKAGRIASVVRKEAGRLIRPGERVIKICEETENMIRIHGGVPAFPTNVSVDHITAHYTSPPDDETLIPEGGLVKLDLGVSVDGYLADTAMTIDLGVDESIMVDTAEMALKAAISTIKTGTSLGEVGKAVSTIIARAKLKPISNLTGHSIARYELHSGISVPNIPIRVSGVMKEGDIYAIEPFVTERNGKGYVKDTRNAFIFSCKTDLPLPNKKDSPEVNLLMELRREFNKLPFAVRWLDHEIDSTQFRKLLKKGLLIAYPVLVEAGKKRVAQAEHTVIVTKYGCEVLTA